MKEETPKYTTIIHSVRISLSLSCNEYCVADMVYHLSNNPVAKVKGWCYASKETLGNFMGLSKQSIHTILTSLLKKGLVVKDENTKWLTTSEKWYKSVILERLKFHSKESLPTVKKVYSKESRKFTPNSKESLHNNNKDNNINNKREYLSQIPIKDLEEFTVRFSITEKVIKSKGESLKLYCESKGKVYKNYRSFLLNALKSDFETAKPVESFDTTLKL